MEEPVVDLNSIRLALKHVSGDDLLMHLIAMDTIKTYKYFNILQVRNLLDALYIQCESFNGWHKGLKTPSGNKFMRRDTANRDAKLNKMSDHSKLKYVIKMMIKHIEKKY